MSGSKPMGGSKLSSCSTLAAAQPIWLQHSTLWLQHSGCSTQAAALRLCSTQAAEVG